MRLLILKCSARKRGPIEPIAAVERYDGPLWQVLRSYRRERPKHAADLVVYGLSAEYGLIAGDTSIPHYDRTMDVDRADALIAEVLRTFSGLMAQDYAHLCLGISDRYLRAMTGWEQFVPTTCAVTITDGPMGTKLGQLRAWLEGREWTPQERPEQYIAPATPPGAVTLSGVRLELTRDEVLERARAALADNPPAAQRYRDWYVLIDDRPVAAKWLAGVISGLSTAQFDAANARRALNALGIDVHRAT
jgi:hypothetical protein